MYKHIKKEHLFIFLVLFSLLVLFTYFNDSFNYTGLTTKDTCTDKGYECCIKGEGTNYFSLDYSCPSNQQCWSSCSETVKETNLITTGAVLDNIWNPIKKFFINIFSKKVRGGEIITGQQCPNGFNPLFTVLIQNEGGYHVNYDTAANENLRIVCSSNFKRNDLGIPIIYLNSLTNSHVKIATTPQPPNYLIAIDITTLNNQNPECSYKLNSCNAREECLFSISNDDGGGSHVGNCTNVGSFNTKVCCTIPPAGGGPRCGNEEIETGEECEFELIEGRRFSENLNDKTCITQGFTGGDLNCYPAGNANQCTFDTSRCTGNGEILPFTQSDYEVYWANDKVVALSFNVYMQRSTAQLPSIAKFKVYRSSDRNDLITNNSQRIITILKKSATSGKAIRDYRGIVETGTPIPGYEDDKYDFWDDYPNNALADGTTYYYKIVPVDSQNREYSNENSIIQITPQATNTQITVSGSCSGTNYGSCSTVKPQYCGYQDNLINNSGFDSDFTLWNNYGNQFTIQTVQNHIGENSKVMHININTPATQDIYSLSQTVINVKPNTYYRLSEYIKAQNIEQTKPLLIIGCFSDKLSDGKKRDFLVSLNAPQQIRPNVNVDNTNNQWINYKYVFKTYNGANKCSINPIYFQGPDPSANRQIGAKGEVWIDGLRLEEIGQVSATASTFNDDCGICGCPAGNSCLVNGSCGLTPRQETCDLNKKTADDDGDGIKALFDSDCASVFKNNISIEESIPSSEDVYAFTNIDAECKYIIKDPEGNEKNAREVTLSDEQLLEKCIELSIDSEQPCKERKISVRNNLVSFKDCNVGDIGEGIPVRCSVSDKCAIYDEEGSQESLINIKEYNYCSEINEGIVEIVNNEIILSSANEPGEELTVSGKVLTDQNDVITVKAALIDLENNIILKEAPQDVTYEGNSESFELKLEIPQIVSGNYFVYVKAYLKDQESSSCTQTFSQKEIKSNLEDNAIEFETSCINQIDDDNDGLTDCKDDDCSTDQACITQCQEGASCNTNLPGVCSIGRQTCLEDGSFGECTALIQPGQRQEISSNGLDDDCNGQVDETGAQLTADSDNDGLPDSWEYENFNTLLYNANDDPDNDGISNIDEYRDNTNPNIADKKKISLMWLWIILGIIILAVIIFVLFKLLSKPKSGSISHAYVDPRLRSYIQDSLRKGFTKQQIKQALITKGWSERDIDKALK